MSVEGPERSGNTGSEFESLLRGAAEHLAKKDAATNHVILLHARGAGGGEWLIEVDGGKVQLTHGRGERAPRAEIAGDTQTILAVLEGRKKPLEAFLEGHMRVRGEAAYLEDLLATFEPSK